MLYNYVSTQCLITFFSSSALLLSVWSGDVSLADDLFGLLATAGGTAVFLFPVVALSFGPLSFLVSSFVSLVSSFV